MSPSARSNETCHQFFAARRRRGLSVAAVVLICSAAWAVENRGDNVDSGWAVGTPATAIFDSKSSDPQMRNILHHVLEQNKTPLVRDSGPKLLHPNDGSLRVAERTSASEGWRASGLHVSPWMTAPIRTGSRPTLPADLPLTLTKPPAPAKSTTTEVVAETSESSGLSGSADTTESSASPESGCDGQASTAEAESSGTPAERSSIDIVVTDASPATDPSDDSTDEESAGAAPVDESPAAEPSDTGTTIPVVPSGELPAAETALDAQSDTQSPDNSSDASADKSATIQVAPLPIVETAPPPPLTRQLMSLRSRVRSVLKGYFRKPLNSRENDCWEVMHGMLSYGIHSRILQGSPRGEPITAVGWLCYNKPCKGLTLMYVTPQGELRAKWGVGLQGHSGQLLAMLAQCHVSPDYPIHVGKSEFTIRDLIDAEKKTCYPKTELTFKLLAFQHYLDLNDEWVNDQGVDWDIPRLIREEIAQPIRGAACGGTHRLSALSLTVKARQRRGEPVDGDYAEAAEFVKKYQKYAFRLQNRDGSLSTEWFRGRGDEDDIDRRIKTTGHILEWLCYSLDDEQLREPHTIWAVTYLANIMYSNYDHEWEVGPRSHALHALLLYDERVFKPFDKAGDVANYRPAPSTANRSQRRTTSQR
jgi:hypothetical protein